MQEYQVPQLSILAFVAKLCALAQTVQIKAHASLPQTILCLRAMPPNNLKQMRDAAEQFDVTPPEVWRWAEQKFEILHQVIWHGSFSNNTTSIKMRKDANSERR
jgi:hypothetical protein